MVTLCLGPGLRPTISSQDCWFGFILNKNFERDTCLSFSPSPSLSPPNSFSSISLFLCASSSVLPYLCLLFPSLFVFLSLNFSLSLSLFLSSYQGSGVVPDFLPWGMAQAPGIPRLPAEGIPSGYHGPMQAFCPQGGLRVSSRGEGI